MTAEKNLSRSEVHELFDYIFDLPPYPIRQRIDELYIKFLDHDLMILPDPSEE